jgi:hypothetical protein
MPLDASLLTQKFGGVPGWMIAVGGAGLAYFLFVRKGAASGAPASAAAGAGTFDPKSYQEGFFEGASYYQTQGTRAAATAPTGSAPPSQPGKPWPPRPLGVPPATQPTVGLPSVPGTGGGGPVQQGRGNSIGSRAAEPHAYFHGSMKRQPKFPHFTHGGVGGAEAVHATAHAAGVHPARLQALNPLRHRFIRVA